MFSVNLHLVLAMYIFVTEYSWEDINVSRLTNGKNPLGKDGSVDDDDDDNASGIDPDKNFNNETCFAGCGCGAGGSSDGDDTGFILLSVNLSIISRRLTPSFLGGGEGVSKSWGEGVSRISIFFSRFFILF